ncbi:MAG: hypothetical protein GY821_17015 [Gammaproteobacteria bacterium]|nr:hypothetical protein [Gammaproteobacteria bacterium]
MEGSSTEKALSANKYQKIITGLAITLVLALIVIVVLAVLLYQAKMSHQSIPAYHHTTSTTRHSLT